MSSRPQNRATNYIPKSLPLDEIYTLKIHSMNHNTLMADIELFMGGVSIFRREVDKCEFLEIENKVHQSQKLY